MWLKPFKGIRKCNYRYKKFSIEFIDKDLDDAVFSTSYFSTCKQIKWLCNNYKNFFKSIWEEPNSVVKLIRQQVEDEANQRREPQTKGQPIESHKSVQ